MERCGCQDTIPLQHCLNILETDCVCSYSSLIILASRFSVHFLALRPSGGARPWLIEDNEHGQPRSAYSYNYLTSSQ